MTYDGSNWRATSIPNTNNYDRRLHNNYVKAAAAVVTGSLVCGTSAGYREIDANVSFDLSYPILWAGGAWESGKQYANAYEAYPSVDPTKTGTVQGAAVNKMLWLKGTVTGTTFKVAASNFLTCTIPTSADNFYYIPLGVIPNDSTAKIYFSTSDKLYAFLDGAFQRVDISATTRIHKAETAIEQTNEQVALKANSSDVYTKTESDGLISTEVSNRNAAITAKANEITQSVSSTYATKTALNGKADSSTVTALTNRVTTAESTITQHTTDISARATKTEFNALEIGGRNLLKRTEAPEVKESSWNVDPATMSGWAKWSTAWTVENTDGGIKGTSTSTSKAGFAVPLVKENAAVGGVEYVLSFDYRTNRTTIGDIYLLCQSGGNVLMHSNGCIASADEWQHYEQVITWPSTSGKTTRALLLPYFGQADDWFEIRNGSLKLERGNRATDWTPAPEDLESYADAAVTTAKAEIKLTTDSISSDVAKVVDGLSQSSHFVQTETGFNFTVDDAIESAQSAADTAQNTADEAKSEIQDAVADFNVSLGGISSNVSEIVDGLSQSSHFQQDGDSFTFSIDSAIEEAAKTATEYLRMTEEGLTLANSDSEIRQVMSNTKNAFKTDAGDIAWFGLNDDGIWEMHIATTYAEDMIRFGNYAWIKRDNGNMTIKWLGE